MNCQEMPRYQCHKKVWALKIASIEIDPATGGAWIVPEDSYYARFKTHDGWAIRYKGGDDDLGYYVVYDDGYASWSPSKAFEDGYTRL
ncbi:MAG: hypothetical protein EOQ49_28310 [Mesorhizobium sp.]|nr:MAG: hypothetical protein EOQ49_28310 [Mesorhizobium sp.]